MATCQECGEEVKKNASRCVKCKAALYYAHSQIRFDMWQYIAHHGLSKARELYNLMAAEEDKDWVDSALGSKLVDALKE